ncbi:MAG: ZIP family metal transporter, partial [Clostridia bacterium]|nr:ZIP family metal transporter [Clostridia bacterium]
GIAVQNFPEGAIVSLPLAGVGQSRGKSFLLGFLSGAVEPAGAFLTLIFTACLTPILPFVLCFAAGAMIYVVVSELIPCLGEEEDDRAAGNAALIAGFALMMALDLSLG